ncbi:hypothetical protein ABBQ32_013111 [Trebouxia sp. C0010 RCD-2024]
MELSDTKAEHLLVYILLCCMALYLAKTLFSFRSSGLSVRRDTDEEGELSPVLEDDNEVAGADHSD